MVALMAPIPMQGLQATSERIEMVGTRNAPVSRIVNMICRKPGDSVRIFR